MTSPELPVNSIQARMGKVPRVVQAKGPVYPVGRLWLCMPVGRTFQLQKRNLQQLCQWKKHAESQRAVWNTVGWSGAKEGSRKKFSFAKNRNNPVKLTMHIMLR